MSERNTIATICARGGSKGVPGKNTRELGGVPLVARAIKQALDCPSINAGVYVSTDCPEIARISKDAGAVVPFVRPKNLATDDAGKVPVIEHLCDFLEADGHHFGVVVDLDPTCPLRIVEDIEGAIAALSDETDVVIGCTNARKNPYFNMVEADADGFVTLSKPTPNAPTSRQESPRVLEISGAVYVWHRETIHKGLWGGRARAFEMPAERSVDIDSDLDFRFVEFLLSR